MKYIYLWDDAVAGRSPDTGLDKAVIVKGEGDQAASGGGVKAFNRSLSIPASPGTQATPTTPLSAPTAARNGAWRSVVHPGCNLAAKGVGASRFDKPESANSPTIYDWLYSGETRSKHH